MNKYFRIAYPDDWMKNEKKYTCIEHALVLDHDWAIRFGDPEHRVILYVWNEDHKLTAAIDVTADIIWCSNNYARGRSLESNLNYWELVADRLRKLLESLNPDGVW